MNDNIQSPAGGVDGVENHENDVLIAPLEKDGEKMMKAVEEGKMAAILSKNEILYAFIYGGKYQCFIHPLAAEEGRRKTFDINPQNRAVIKNLAELADQVFVIEYSGDKHPMGVMVAAETGIINFLDNIGCLPADDFDFMTGETIE